MEFLKDKKYLVHVVVIPTNSGIYDVKKHDQYEFMIEKGIIVTSIYEFGQPKYYLQQAVKFFYYISRLAFLKKVLPIHGDRLKRILFYLIRVFSRLDNDFTPSVIQKFQSSIVIVDEIIFHHNRSFFIDKLLEDWKKNKFFKLYAFSTGQDPYTNLWDDKEWGKLELTKNNVIDVPLFVPGPNDEAIMKSQLPNVIVKVLGNPRFDKLWVNFQNEIVQLNSNLKKNLPSVHHRIVFMLSKFEYGVDSLNLVEAINTCAKLDSTIVVVKPHTRGMNFWEVGNEINPQVIDGSGYSSSELIHWSNSIFFTGSSIVFHALVLRKNVIYLRYCQKYKSIYDNSRIIKVANSVDDVLKSIDASSENDLNEKHFQSYLALHIYNGNENGTVSQDVKKYIESLAND